MECLVDESYGCKSSIISNTLDCKDSGCSHYIKMSKYYENIQKNKKQLKSDSKNGME